MQNWEKIDFLIDQKIVPWAINGLITPTPHVISDNIVRIFFGGRDINKMSRIGYIDVDFETFEVKYFSANPIVDLGSLGLFDDCGVLPGSLVYDSGKLLLYYSGVTLQHSNLFLPSTGLLISDNNGESFRRYSDAPVIDRNYNDPYHATGSYVLKSNDNWKMWYQSATNWVYKEDGSTKHFYTIKNAVSKDGIKWTTNKNLCINYSNGEYAITRPSILYKNKKYHMWFCYRGGENQYRIGYAFSTDGVNWNRVKDFSGISVSSNGWDNEMICYPSVFRYKKLLYMLYNGNGYGKTGFGIAQLDESCL